MRLPSATRLVLAIGLGLAVITTVGIGAATAAIYRGGTIHFDLRVDDGADIAISLPAGLAEVALSLVPSVTLRALGDEFEPLPAELSRVWPAVRSSYRELERAEDFVLVEVHDAGERTIVQKRGGMLLIDFEGNDGECHVALPLATLESLLAKLEQAFAT